MIPNFVSTEIENIPRPKVDTALNIIMGLPITP